MDEKDLESRILKIEEYIKCCEKNKDQQWRDSFIKKLDDVKNDIKSEIKDQSKKGRRNAGFIYLMNIGLVAIVFSSNFEGFNLTISQALMILIVGLVAFLFSWILWNRLT